MNEILNIIHKTIYQFFDTCEDDEEVPMSDKDELLLEVNKAICNNLKALEQQSCEDTISRQAVLDLFAEKCDAVRPYHEVWQAVEVLPPIKPQPKIGHWIESTGWDNRDHFYHCSECGRNINLICGATLADYPYCHCGAKMIEPQESEDSA